MYEIEEKIRQILIDKLGIEANDITRNASFTDDLETDSLDVFEVIIEVENTFRLNIPGEDVERIKTVGDLVAYVEEKTSPKVHAKESR